MYVFIYLFIFIFSGQYNTCEVSLEFFIRIKSFQCQWHYGPGVDTASNRHEYQEHFLGVKAAGA